MTAHEVAQLFQRPPPSKRNWRTGIRRPPKVRGIPHIPALTRKSQARVAAREALRSTGSTAHISSGWSG